MATTAEQIRQDINKEYLMSFIKKVGVIMRRLNIACSNGTSKLPDTLSFHTLKFDLRYVGYKFTMLMDEPGTRFTVLAGKSVVAESVDLRQIKAGIVNYIRHEERAKKQVRDTKKKLADEEFKRKELWQDEDEEDSGNPV